MFTGEVIMIINENDDVDQPNTLDNQAILEDDIVLVGSPSFQLDNNTASIRNASELHTTPNHSDLSVMENCTDANDDQIQVSVLPSSSKEMPQPFERQYQITLPKFSDYVESRLVGGKPMAMFPELVSQLAYGLLAKYKMDTKGEYDTVGQLMLKKYPCVNVDKTSRLPYRYLIQKLSQKVRHIRWLEKKRNGSPNVTTSNKVRRKGISSVASTSYSVELETEDISYEAALLEIKVEFAEEDKDVPKLLRLHRMTFGKRRQWIIDSNEPLLEILKTFPQLSDCQFLDAELNLILNKESTKELFAQNMDKIFNLLKEQIYKDGEEELESEFSRTLALVKFLEKTLKTTTTQRKRSKGQSAKQAKAKSEKMHYSMINIVEAEGVSTLKDAPQIVIVKNDVQQKKVHLVYKDFEMQCELPLQNCIYALLAFYYTFDLNYPGVLGQVLGFFQEYGLRDLSPKAMFIKSFKYLNFVEEISLDSLISVQG